MAKLEKSRCNTHGIRYLYYCPECRPDYKPIVSLFEYDSDSKPTEYLLGSIARAHDIEIELVHSVYEYCRANDISVDLVLRRIKNNRHDFDL